MTCNYFDYRDMTNKMFYGVGLADNHLNKVTEQIRQYLVNGGAGAIIKALNIGVRVITKKGLLLPEEVVKCRFIWLDGERAGEELTITEIINIGVFLKHGALYGKCGISTQQN